MTCSALPHRARRRAFTLVELLVVITIIGILVSLLMPAVQSSREAARRMECSNNQRQIVVALHNYHGVSKSFPPGIIGGWGHSWPAHILGHLEQRSLFEALPWSEQPNWYATDQNSLFLQELSRTRIPSFRCPAQTGPELESHIINGRYVTSYLGNSGNNATHDSVDTSSCTIDMSESNGVFLVSLMCWTNSLNTVAMTDVLDGTSSTFLIGEAVHMTRPPGCTYCQRFSFYHPWFDGGCPYPDDFSQVLGSCYFPPNLLNGPWPQFEISFSSYHPGGCNMSLVDGSTRFVSETIDMTTWRALGSRDGGEVVGRY